MSDQDDYLRAGRMFGSFQRRVPFMSIRPTPRDEQFAALRRWTEAELLRRTIIHDPPREDEVADDIPPEVVDLDLHVYLAELESKVTQLERAAEVAREDASRARGQADAARRAVDRAERERDDAERACRLEENRGARLAEQVAQLTLEVNVLRMEARMGDPWRLGFDAPPASEDAVDHMTLEEVEQLIRLVHPDRHGGTTTRLGREGNAMLTRLLERRRKLKGDRKGVRGR